VSRFSIVTTCFNEYELLRQLVESILCNVDKETYDKLIIADDFSKLDGKLRQYLEYLQKTYDFIDVILHDKSYDSVYNDWPTTTPESSNWGPVVNLMHGVERVNTEFTLNVDNDTVFLAKSRNVLAEMAEYFDRYPDVVIMGQVQGDRERFKVHTDPGRYWNDNNKIGSPSPMANAVRMSLIKDGISDYVLPGHLRDKPVLAGWNHAYLLRGIFAAKLHTMNFPLFGDLYMVHIGGAVVDLQVEGRKMRKFAYCLDFQGNYGGKGGGCAIRDWYSGRAMINMTHNQYLEYLREQYNRPFEDVRPFNESILKIAD
jgi:hypothetical protein